MGGGQKEQPRQESTFQMSPEQRQLFSLAIPKIAQFAASTPKRYQGEQVAGFTPAQTAAQETALGAAGTQADIANRAFDVWGGIPGSLTDFQRTPLQTSSDITVSPETWARATPTLNAATTAATRPIWEGLTESALPAIRGTGAGTSGLTTSGSRQGIAEGVAAGKAARAAGDVGSRMAQDTMNQLLGLTQQRYATNIGAEGQRYATDVGAEGQRYGQNLAAMYQALGLAPTLQTMQAAPAATLAAVGEQQQAMEQARINEAIQNFNFDQLGGYLQAKDILSLVQGMPGGTNISTANVPKASPFSQALGGAATGASVGSIFGPIGTGVGAVGGAALPFLFQ
jgi:hypothetical protein